MTAAASLSAGAGWTSVVAAAVFLVALLALALDRSRTKRRLAELERSEALLETDLADARREVAALRECLRDDARVGEPGVVRDRRPGDPTTPVG